MKKGTEQEQMYRLEVCVENMASALAAQEAGADRIELCANLMIGGTTPSMQLYEQIRTRTQLDVRILIRPRFGDFCYDVYEVEEMTEQIRLFRRAGAQGVVIGVLRPDGSLDIEVMRRMIEAAGDMRVTLHRAFDVCADGAQCLEDAVGLGIGTILTSGRCEDALAGAEELRKFTEQAAGRIDIMAGGGICADVIEDLAHRSGIRTFHMSGKKIVESSMKYRNHKVSMGVKGFDEFERWQSDPLQIKRALTVLRSIDG